MGENLYFTVEPWETKGDHGETRIMYLAQVITGTPKEADPTKEIHLQLPAFDKNGQLLNSVQVPNGKRQKVIDGYLIDVVDQALPVYKITYSLA